MDRKILICFALVVLLLAPACAKIPKQGDSVRITTLDGTTYYGTVEDLTQGLIGISCDAFTTSRIPLAEPLNLVGGKDLNYHSPIPRKIDPVDVCIGLGAVQELIWI